MNKTARFLVEDVCKGRLIHLYGEANTGKTTLALMASAEVCRAGGKVCYIDRMGGFTPEYAESLGILPGMDFTHVREDGLREAVLGNSHRIAEVDLMVFDAIMSSPGTQSLDKALEDLGIWNTYLQDIQGVVRRHGTIYLAIDSDQDGVGRGGKPWQYRASRRIRLQRVEGGVQATVVKDMLARLHEASRMLV